MATNVATSSIGPFLVGSERGWQTLTATMQIPATTRSLVIHFGAGTADDAGPKTKHYLDATSDSLLVGKVAEEKR